MAAARKLGMKLLTTPSHSELKCVAGTTAVWQMARKSQNKFYGLPNSEEAKGNFTSMEPGRESAILGGVYLV